MEDVPGVTRDRIYIDAEWSGHEFTIIDTGGIDAAAAAGDAIYSAMRQQAEIAVAQADVIVLVVDAKTGVTTADQEVVAILRAADKPVVLAVNKVDSAKDIPGSYEFYNLGLGDPIAISAANGLNIGDLLDAIVERFPESPGGEGEAGGEEEIKVAVVGRPNVGKSSLVNALLGQERVIVSDLPGTTRDAVDIHFIRAGTPYVLIDTAGMRRKAKVDAPVERYSVLRALRAVDRSDVALLVIDATEGVTEQDKKIAGYVHEGGKGSIIVVNKWDLVEKDSKTALRFTAAIRNELAFLQYAPILYTSALTRQRVHRITGLVKYVAEQHAMRISTSMFNKVLADAVNSNPPAADRGRRVRVYYGAQTAVRPPTFAIFTNEPDSLHFSYLRYLENKLREAFGFEGTPVRFVVRGRRESEERR